MRKFCKTTLSNNITSDFFRNFFISGKSKNTIIVMLSLLIGLFFYQASYCAESRNSTQLKVNVPVSNIFKNGNQHFFSVSAEPNEVVAIECERRNIDIGLTAFTPDGQKILLSNSPAGFVGIDRLFFIAEKAGEYRISLESRRPGNMQGSYTIVLKPKRAAVENDFTRADGMRLLGTAREVLKGSDNRYEKAAEAIQALEKAVVIFVQTGDLSGQANAHFQIGYIVAREHGKEKDAIKSYEKALAIWRNLGDEASISICLPSFAHELRTNGEDEKSLFYFNEAITLNRKLKSPLDEAISLSLICKLFNDTQQFQKGFEACRESIRLGGDVDPLGDITAYESLASLFGVTGDATDSLKYLKIAQMRVQIAKEFVNPIRLAGIILGLGDFLFNEKKYFEAETLYQQALDISIAVNRPFYIAVGLTRLTGVFLKSRQFEKSIEYAQKALAIFHQYYPNRQQYPLRLLAESYIAVGEKTRAQQLFNDALKIIQQNRDRYAEADLLYAIAELEESTGNLESAHRNIREAVNISEFIRSQLLGKSERSDYLSMLRRAYEFDIKILIALYEKTADVRYLEQSWQSQEKIRARTLLESFLTNGFDLNNAVNKDFLARQQILLEQIADSEQKRNDAEKAKNSKAQIEAQENLQKALENYQLLQEESRKNNAQFAALDNPKEFSFKDVQKTLDEETAVLEYSLGEKQSFAWLIGKDSVGVKKLPAAEIINQSARDLHSALTDFTKTDKSLIGAKSAALSKAVLQPFAGEIGNFKRILIVADGSLQLIPFAALNVSPDQPVINAAQIVNLPSLSSLIYLQENKKSRSQSADKLLAIFADPVFETDDERLIKNKRLPKPPGKDSSGDAAKLNQTLRNFGLNRLARLPFSGAEAREIAKIAAARVELLLGFDASRKRFLSGDFNRYRILHFATHGFLNQENPDLSGLVLSLYDKNRQKQNGFLRVIDLYALRLNADLVVLSACQTALGKEVGGEGIVGLTNGFIYAGASSVLSTLWKIDDAATAELMTRFYRAMLKEKQSPSEALRTAQNELRQIPRFSHPRYWAGFVLTGDWR